MSAPFWLEALVGGWLGGMVTCSAFVYLVKRKVDRMMAEADVESDGLPEGPAALPVTERGMWLVAEDPGAFGPGLRTPTVSLDDEAALALAKRWSGVVARLPLVADYRDDPTPAPTWNSKVVWRDGGRETHPLTDPIPPGGPIVIQHQGTEDDGSVTIWFRRRYGG